MVDEALTSALRAFAAKLVRFAMRLVPILPAALCAGLGLAAGSAPAWADSPVVIEGAEEDIREAILDLLPDRDRPESLFEAERIAEEAAARARAWLRSEGYYAATVTPEAQETPAVARLIIAPGTRFRFAEPVITFLDAAPTRVAADAAAEAAALVEAGAPARAAPVLEAEAAVLTALQRAGYADAAAAERRVVADHAARTVTVEYRIHAGAFARLGQVRAEPDAILRPGFVDDLRNWELGAAYSPEALRRLRRDISATGAVSRATTRLAEPDAEGTRDVILDIEAARRNAYELGFSYSTTEGAGVVAQWTRRNLTRRADPLIVSGTLSELRQGAAVEWTRPHAAGLGHAVTFGAAATREDTDAFVRQGVALYGSIDASPHLRLGRSYGVRLSADSFDDLLGDVRNATVLSGFADFRHDTTEFNFDPLDGSILEFRIEPSVSAGDATLGFIRATAEGRGYESFGANDRVTLAARVRTGWLEAVSGDVNDVPPDRRFYAGGGGSVRGYAYNSIYPEERDLLGLTPGGQGLLEAQFEVRWRFDDRFGAAAFIDGGAAFDDWGDAGDLSWGAGIGARYNLGFAPLRIDIAVPLDRRDGGEEYALYISLGQAF